MQGRLIETKTHGYHLFRINYLVPGEGGEARPNYCEFEAPDDLHARKNADWLVTHGFDQVLIPIQLNEAGSERVVRRYF
jgi:hypothetical protein